MLGWLKKVAVSVAMLALWGAASANGDAVKFDTYNSFFTPMSGSVGGTGTVLANTSGGQTASITVTNNPLSNPALFATLSYTSALTPTSVTSPVNGVFFGTFLLSTNDAASVESLNGVQFTLQINEYLPGSGGNTTTATVTGTVNLVPNTPLLNPDVVITFTHPTVLVPAGLPDESYTIDTDGHGSNKVLIKTSPGTNPEAAFLLGDVRPVPLPATANMGFGLLGGLGCLTGVNVLRRRRMA
jgi:hypothetical protein